MATDRGRLVRTGPFNPSGEDLVDLASASASREVVDEVLSALSESDTPPWMAPVRPAPGPPASTVAPAPATADDRAPVRPQRAPAPPVPSTVPADPAPVWTEPWDPIPPIPTSGTVAGDPATVTGTAPVVPTDTGSAPPVPGPAVDGAAVLQAATWDAPWRMSVAPLPQAAPPVEAAPAAPAPAPQVLVQRVMVPVAAVDEPTPRSNQGLWLLILALTFVLVLATVALEIVYLTPLVRHTSDGRSLGLVLGLIAR